jgi:hypothetical protein
VDEVSRYEFDRLGYLVVPGLLSPDQVSSLLAAVDRLEERALARIDDPPRKRGLWTSTTDWDHHHDAELGYYATDFGSGLRDGSSREGTTLVIEDFFNADPAFDALVDHPGTMDVIGDIVQGPIRINNSELRIRYTGNATGTHMGGPIGHKYRYSFNADGIDAMMVRMIYFLHDVGEDGGAFSVVPATHKSNYVSPYTMSVDDEPGMIGLPVRSGDGIIFTENLRHGGFTNHSPTTRKTLHVGYGPAWMMSQNVATMDESQYVLPSTLARYNERQRALFELPGWRRAAA